MNKFKNLDILFYKKYHKDLNNLNIVYVRDHFIKFGINQKRIFNKKLINFDYSFYIKHHTDLKNLDWFEACNHFINVGINQKRIFNKKLINFKHNNNNNWLQACNDYIINNVKLIKDEPKKYVPINLPIKKYVPTIKDVPINLPIKDEPINLPNKKDEPINLPNKKEPIKDVPINLPIKKEPIKDVPINLPIKKDEPINLPNKKDEPINLPNKKEPIKDVPINLPIKKEPIKDVPINLPIKKDVPINLPIKKAVPIKDVPINLPIKKAVPTIKDVPINLPIKDYKFNRSNDQLIFIEYLKKNNITHCKISESLLHFSRILSIYNLYNYDGTNYSHKTKNTLFFGLYRENDLDVLNKHIGKKFIMYGGTDCDDRFHNYKNVIKVMNNDNKNTIYIATSVCIQNRLTNIYNISNEKVIRLENDLVDYNIFYKKQINNDNSSIYIYDGDPDSNKHIYNTKICDEIEDKLKHKYKIIRIKLHK